MGPVSGLRQVAVGDPDAGRHRQDGTQVREEPRPVELLGLVQQGDRLLRVALGIGDPSHRCSGVASQRPRTPPVGTVGRASSRADPAWTGSPHANGHSSKSRRAPANRGNPYQPRLNANLRSPAPYWSASGSLRGSARMCIRSPWRPLLSAPEDPAPEDREPVRRRYQCQREPRLFQGCRQ